MEASSRIVKIKERKKKEREKKEGKKGRNTCLNKVHQWDDERATGRVPGQQVWALRDKGNIINPQLHLLSDLPISYA